MTKFIGSYSDRGAVGPKVLLFRSHGSRKISGLRYRLKPYRSSTAENFDLGARL